MNIIEINTVSYGSTGGIMLQISEIARRRENRVYTFSKKWKSEKFNGKYHYFFGTVIDNAMHRILSTITGKECCYSTSGTKQLIRKLKQIEPDIIHLHNLHGWYINLPLLFEYIKENNIRVVWTLHDCWSFTGHCPCFDMVGCDKWKTGCFSCAQYKSYPKSYVDNSKKMYQRKREWFTGVKDLTIVTPSNWLANLVKQSFLKDYPVQVIHNGIDLSIFKPTESDFKERHGLQNKKIVLGVAFGWGKRKGLDVFIELSKRLSSDYQIVLVGTDDKVDKQLPNNILSIHRTQNQKELAEIYTAADVFVNPTREEVLGLVNIESVACGTPVITFKSGGSPECIDESCGFVVEKDDINAMQAYIEQICKENPFSKEMCLNRAKRFDATNKFKEYIELYNNKG